MERIKVVPFAEHPLAKHSGWIRVTDRHLHHRRWDMNDHLYQTVPGASWLERYKASALVGELLYLIRGLKFASIEGDFCLRYIIGAPPVVEHTLASYIDETEINRSEHEEVLNTALQILATTAQELTQMPCIKQFEAFRRFTLQQTYANAQCLRVGHH